LNGCGFAQVLRDWTPDVTPLSTPNWRRFWAINAGAKASPKPHRAWPRQYATRQDGVLIAPLHGFEPISRWLNTLQRGMRQQALRAGVFKTDDNPDERVCEGVSR